MNREIRGLIFEIIFLCLIIVIVVPLFIVFSCENVSAREVMTSYSNRLTIDIVYDGINENLYQMSDEEAINTLDGSVIKVTNTDNEDVDYNFIFKMSKVYDYSDYKIMFNGNIFNLDELDYREDDDYRYFILDHFVIENKEEYFTFMIWLDDDNTDFSYENFHYAYMIEEI